MNEVLINSIIEGMDNVNYRGLWLKDMLAEAGYVLDNKEELLRDYDCYDHLFE